MAVILGYLDAADSGLSSQLNGNGIVYSGRSPNMDVPPQWQAETLFHVDDEVFAAGFQKAGAPVAPPASKFLGQVVEDTHDHWFEKMHVLERKVSLGIITVDQLLTVEIYNAYRYSPRIFSAFVNNAGAGVGFTDIPALPVTIQEQDNLLLTLQVLVGVGPPLVDDTLEYAFDVGTIVTEIEFQRAVMFPFEPEAPLVERLGFLTDVIPKRDGKEQRTSLRVAPRQSFDATFALEGYDRRLLESVVFDGQSRPLGFPVWTEPALLTAAVVAGNTVLPVDSTAFADFRVGSYVMLFQSPKVFEVQAVATGGIAPTALTLAAPLVGGFPVRTRVLPVRIAFAGPSWRGSKAPVTLQTVRVTFDVIDNDVDLSSAAAFPTFSSKVLLSEANAVDGDLSESWEREMFELDGRTGVFNVYSEWPNSRRVHQKTFVSRTRQRLWEVRQLLHHLRGRQVSFYVPTFYPDLVPVADISNGGSTVDVENVGYTKFVKNRAARNVIQVLKTDGTTLMATVTASTELTPDVERLTVTPNWSAGATVAQVRRISYMEKVRMDSDEVTIEHFDAVGTAVIRVPVRAVLE